MGDGKKFGIDYSSWPLSVQRCINTPRALELVRQAREKTGDELRAVSPLARTVMNWALECGASPAEIERVLARRNVPEAEIEATMREAAQQLRREGERELQLADAIQRG
jgi:hypothetical protein